MQQVLDVLPTAFSFTLLGGVESLLSAKVADGMTGRKHRYNMELVAQGIANIASALVRRHQRHGHDRADRDQHPRRRTQPVIRHDACGFPAALHDGRRATCELHPTLSSGRRPAGCVLEHGGEEGVRCFAPRLADRSRLLTTFGLTVCKDLTFGIVAGCVLAAVFAILHRSIPSEGGPSS